MSTVTGKDSHQDSKDSFRQGCWEADSSAVHLQTPTSAEDTSGPVCSDGRLCQGQAR